MLSSKQHSNATVFAKGRFAETDRRTVRTTAGTAAAWQISLNITHYPNLISLAWSRISLQTKLSMVSSWIATTIRSGRQISFTTGKLTTWDWCGTQPVAGRALVSHQLKQVSMQSAARKPAGQATSPTCKKLAGNNMDQFVHSGQLNGGCLAHTSIALF